MTPAMFASFVAQQAAHRRRQMQAENRKVTPAEPVKPDWRAMHWKQQVKLARDMGADVTTTAEARAWLEANAG